MGAAPAQNDPADRCLALSARLPGALVDTMLKLKESFLPVRIDVV